MSICGGVFAVIMPGLEPDATGEGIVVVEAADGLAEQFRFRF